VQLAAIRVQLIQLKDEMDSCVEKQDFQRAAELKDSISELETSRQSLVNNATPPTAEVRTEKVSIIVFCCCYFYIFTAELVLYQQLSPSVCFVLIRTHA